jgi:glycosyltransferase involved in cell wall biosynthesis
MQLRHVALPASIRDVEKTLRSLMPGNEPVIVHGFHNRGVKLAAYLGTYWRLLGLPVACVAHRGVTSRPVNPLPYLLPGIRAYLVNSKACADTLPLLWRRRRCHVVNNSMPHSRAMPLRSKRDMRVDLNIPEEWRIIGTVSRDNPLKGAGQAMKAFALSRRELPPAKLVIVGVTPEKWQPLCEDLGISEDVRLVPKTGHVADYLQLMDILIFPSSFIESQPNAIIEAMVMGLPVIAGDVGGISELLPGECLFHPQNIQEISAMLIRLMREPDALQRLGKANAAQQHRFSQERRLQIVMEHYRQALSELPRRSGC